MAEYVWIDGSGGLRSKSKVSLTSFYYIAFATGTVFDGSRLKGFRV
jgi:glutamine synthetase